MMYVIAENVAAPIDYESQAPMGEDRHTWLRDEINNRISSTRYREQFLEKFDELRRNRHAAEYGQKFFTREECFDIQESVRSILSLLRNVK